MVKETLRKEIMDGKYQINQKLPTESELMQRFNVSRYTIRRAIGDLENEHYVYRIQGGGMFVQDWQRDWTANDTNKIIGVISTHMADYIFPSIISGIDSVITDKGYSIIVGNTLNSPQRGRQTLLNMLDLKIAGLIIEPSQSALPNPNLDLYRQITEYKIPTILFHSTYPELTFPTLLTNDKKGEQALVEYLFQLGHQRILGVFQVDDQQGVDRMHGMIQAYQSAGTPLMNSNIIMYQSADSYDDIIDRVDNVLASPATPTAIACYNDQLATHLIGHLQKTGRRVPDDVSVVGFDNYDMAQVLSPTLTTVDHPKRRLGRDAGEMILKMINGEEVTSKTYDVPMIVGNSTKALK
ncbi:GntR family transcriptional regulator [Limosilactobacillus pontis]|nr:GntR family transcriptional regulator [Limosilactobacillus pontis]MCX2188670.1 GntR family transcriptional regulator [Limosilactobacillus pontis]